MNTKVFVATIIASLACFLSCKEHTSTYQVNSVATNHPVVIKNSDGSCFYQTSLDESRPAIGIWAKAEDIGVGFTIEKSDLPLKDGFKKDLSYLVGPGYNAYLTYANGMLKYAGKSDKDFLEQQWLEMKVDPALLKPTEIVTKWGAGLPVPLRTRKCVIQ
jgi:hypothetical protein